MQNVLRVCVVIAVSFALLPAVMPGASPAHAQDDCPEEDGSVTIEARVEDAPMVLEGIITDVFSYTESLPRQQVAVVEVIQYFKGTGPATITLSGFGQRENCLQPVQASEEPLVFFVINDAGTFRAYYPLLPNGAYLMTDDLRNSILAATGQDAATPDPSLEPNISAMATAQRITAGDTIDKPPTQAPVAIAPTSEEPTVVVQEPTQVPTATPSVATGTQSSSEDDDGEGIDIWPVVLGVVVLVVMLGGGLLFASRRSEPEEEE